MTPSTLSLDEKPGGEKAPVALFVYNRPQHTRQTVEALTANAEAKDTDLYVFSDAPRNKADQEAVNEVRAYVHEIGGFRSVTVIEREANLGLAKSIIDGVSQVCEQHGRVIVLEDDMITSPYFLQFMNHGLDFYADEERVISVAGYIYPVADALPETFFLRGADCWGWATWQRGWDLFEPDGRLPLEELRRQGLTQAFDLDGSYPYTKMLRHQIAGKNNSWAIRWYASAFLQNKLTLYPGRSLVHNIGMDDSGTHCSNTTTYEERMADTPIHILPVPVEESATARRSFIAFHRSSRPNLLTKVLRKSASMMKKRMGMA